MKPLSMGTHFNVKKVIGRAALYVIIILIAFVMIFPLLWMLSSSFKRDTDIFEFPIQWIAKNPYPQNYQNVWTRLHYAGLMTNTIFITVCATVLQLVTSSLAGYAFAKIPFRGNKLLFVAYLSTLMVPYQVVMIPQFVIVRLIGLTNNLWGVILILAFSPFGVFLMRQFFKSIPIELSEASRIDGLGEFGIYWRIILPLSKPALASLTIFTSVNVWNDFLTPLIYINSSAKWTIQLGLRSLFAEFTADYGGVMAGAVLAVVPVLIVFVILQRFFIQGVVMSGLQG
jgi:multiple sugar transport system permease protein